MSLIAGSFVRARVALFAFCVFSSARVAPAAERWFVAQLSSLEWTDGKPSPLANQPWRLQDAMWNDPGLVTSVQLDGDGEAYLVASPADPATDGAFGEILSIVARTNSPGDLTGRVIGPDEDGNKATSSAFRVPGAAAASEPQLALFLQGKAEHYERLASADLPGRAWFAHQALEARAAIAASSGTTAAPAADVPRPTQRFGNETGLDATFATFSGARALAENLQWDRELRLSTQQDETVLLDTIAGISTRAFDWTPLVKDLKPEVDPLANSIPEDQYAVLCPSFDAYLGLADELERRASPLVDLFSARATKGLPREKYERQLGLGLSALTRLFGDRFVKSVAMTGADVDFESGTDIALLFESENADGLHTLLRTKLELAAADDVERGSGQFPAEGEAIASWSFVRTPDRSLCSYLARIGSTIVVTNSKAQLDAIVQTASGARKSLASLDEYRFFRDRYPRGAGENALVLLSDPTIRRWCSPKWRIGSSRRARACQEFAELHAREIDRGSLSEEDSKARAALGATYGSFQFVTPAVELAFDRVTQAEADAYGRFRNSYQSRWANYFDPIALKIAIDGTALDTDLTVMPLIAGSEFREFTEVTAGVELKPGDGDPHAESIAHYVQAINPDSSIFKTGQGMFESMTGEIDVNPISWIGNHFSVYFDDGAIWDDFAKAKSEDSDFEDLVEARLNEIPVAFEVAVKDALGCAAFLTFLRTYANDSAPGLVRFQTKKHGEDAYVQVSGDFGAGTDEDGRPAEHHLFYCVSPRRLTVSLNEDVIRRAIDRKNAAEKPAAPFGKSITLELKQRVLQSLDQLLHEEFGNQRRNAAWGALPILNEWKRLFPNEDPVAVHQRLWGETIADPLGGTFRWNESMKTMESSTCGNPLAPKKDAVEKSFTESFTTVQFGLTFEHDGLRARMRIDK